MMNINKCKDITFYLKGLSLSSIGAQLLIHVDKFYVSFVGLGMFSNKPLCICFIIVLLNREISLQKTLLFNTGI